MRPTYYRHTRTLPSSDRTCVLLREAFSPEECRVLIERAEDRGFLASARDYPGTYRNNDRMVLDDRELARRLFERLRVSLPERRRDEDGNTWRLVGLNERFRFCRYRSGQSFAIHQDGVFARSAEERSHLTLMIYLNDSTEFRGGATRFFASRDPSSEILCAIRPERGALVVFGHELWHDGEPVDGGVKYIMRTDVMYVLERSSERRIPVRRLPADSSAEGVSSSSLSGHLGYVWSVIELDDGVLATGSRDKTVRLWQPIPGAGGRHRTFVPCRVLTGHASSVSALVERVPGELWSGARDRTLRVWRRCGAEPASVHLVRVIEGHGGAVLALAKLGDGRIASASADGTIRLWRADGTCAAVIRSHDGWVWALTEVAPAVLASGGDDGKIRIWSLDDGRPTGVLEGHRGAVLALARTKTRGSIASGSADRTVKVWSLDERRMGGECLATLSGHTGEVCALAELGGGLLASGAEDDTIRLWDLEEGHATGMLAHASFVRTMVPLRDGRLASGSYDATVRIWGGFGAQERPRC